MLKLKKNNSGAKRLLSRRSNSYISWAQSSSQHFCSAQLQGPVPCKEQASQEDKGEHAKRMPEPTRHTRQLWFHGKHNTCDYSSVLVKTAIRGGHAATLSLRTVSKQTIGRAMFYWRTAQLSKSKCQFWMRDNHQAHIQICKKKKSNPITGLDRPWGLQEAEAPRFQDNRHMNVVSPTHRPSLTFTALASYRLGR